MQAPGTIPIYNFAISNFQRIFKSQFSKLSIPYYCLKIDHWVIGHSLKIAKLRIENSLGSFCYDPNSSSENVHN